MATIRLPRSCQTWQPQATQKLPKIVTSGKFRHCQFWQLLFSFELLQIVPQKNPNLAINALSFIKDGGEIDHGI